MRGSAAITGSIMAVVLGVIMLVAGIYAVSIISNALPAPDSNSAFYTAYTNTLSYGGTAFTILGVVLIVAGIATLLAFLRAGFA